jgi:hypothetical protein
MIRLISTIATVILLVSTSAAQDARLLNAYKYVYVSMDDDKLVEPWESLKYLLVNKNFIVLKTENGRPELPIDAKVNPCLAAGWTVKGSQVGRRRGMNIYDLYFIVVDCKKEIVYQSKSVKVRQDSKDGFRQGITAAFRQLDNLKYSFDDSLNNDLYLPKVEVTNESEESLRKYLDNNKVDGIEGIYKTTEGQNQYRIGIRKVNDKYIGIVCETNVTYWRPGEVKIYLESTLSSSVFATTLLDVVKRKVECFTEFDGLTLSIEVKNQEKNENVTIANYVKLYPRP